MGKKEVPSDIATITSVDVLVKACHARAYNNGWWNDPKTGEYKPRPVPELLCLIHSEVSEALEGYRKDLNDDHLPQHKMLDTELADALIRICDAAGGLGIDLAQIVVDKLNYNDSRADHKPENRAKEGGKKI
jgi:NTP pyrophosphatase (non-canonical NTP hydrolase)